MQYAYLHGFASSSKSTKGLALAEHFEERGVELHRPDLNKPSFEQLTYSGMVEAVESYVAECGPDDTWRFIGSSMGGYVAARWAELHPERTDRMVLLCPGFDMATRWVELLGEESLRGWKEDGSFLFFDAEDDLTAVHWELYRDARDEHPAYPEVDASVLILHGREDAIVPLETSRTFVEGHGDARLEVLEDNHRLHDSVDTIADRALEFFGVDGSSPS